MSIGLSFQASRVARQDKSRINLRLFCSDQVFDTFYSVRFSTHLIIADRQAAALELKLFACENNVSLFSRTKKQDIVFLNINGPSHIDFVISHGVLANVITVIFLLKNKPKTRFFFSLF